MTPEQLKKAESEAERRYPVRIVYTGKGSKVDENARGRKAFLAGAQYRETVGVEGMRWVKCNEQKPVPELDVLFDGGEHGLVYGKYRRNGNVDYVVYKDMDFEDHYERYSLYERWLDESPTPSDEVKRLREALEKIVTMKREPGETTDTYVYNRCWHIANEALNPQP